MFGLENRGETLIFRSSYFDQTMTILISHYLRFGALNILTGDHFVLKIIKQSIPNEKLDVLFILVFFFQTHARRCAYQHVKVKKN